MTSIGIVSDTHGVLPNQVFDFIKDCDEIWHAGDIGNESVFENIFEKCKIRGVYGNIDSQDIRFKFPLFNAFNIEGIAVLMTHIGGYPKKYDTKALKLIEEQKPKLFVCGHSHILRIMYDQKYNMLVVNPGAAGKYGFHKVITAVRLKIKAGEMYDMEIFELQRK